MPFVSDVLKSNYYDLDFIMRCIMLGLLAMVTAYLFTNLWRRSGRKKSLKARVVQKQVREMARYKDYADDPNDMGEFSFGNGALNEYILWMEIMDQQATNRLGVSQVCNMDGYKYRNEWGKIPENAQGTISLKQVPVFGDRGSGKETEWDLECMELDRDPDTGDFIVLN